MKQRNNGGLHIVKGNEDVSEKLVDAVADNLYIDDSDPMQDMKDKIKRHRIWFWKNVILSVVTVVMVIVGTYMLITIQTYTRTSVISTVRQKDGDSGQFLQYADGVLQYSKDGVSLINEKGKEEWNQPAQIKSPIAEVCDNGAVVADKGGNSILVFQKNGLKGEIQTTLPIEKVTVSSQGIVGAVLKDDVTPRIVCYDAAGNLLAEQKVSVSGTGYPVGIDISQDGSSLMVSYLHVKDGVISSTVAYYNFSTKDGEGKEQKLKGDSYKDEVMPDVFFMDNETSAVIGDKSLVIYKGKESPKVFKKINIGKNVKSTFHSGKYVGLILKNQGKTGYELRLYTAGGKLALSKDIDNAYKNVKVSGDQVIMYEGKNCSIYLKSGIHKFQGELDVEAQEIIPVLGVNKYMLMSTDGMQQVRFVK